MSQQKREKIISMIRTRETKDLVNDLCECIEEHHCEESVKLKDMIIEEILRRAE